MSRPQVKFITFEECADVWSTKLWPGRKDIEPASAMVYSPETVELKYDMRNMELPQVFFGLFFGGEMIGVNSGHVCGDGSFRSRGLWVDWIYRGKGLGIELLTSTIHYAHVMKSTFIWSYPRFTSRKSYEAAGFTITSDWRASDTSDSNAYCIKKIVESK